MFSKVKNFVQGLRQYELIFLVLLLNFLNNYIFHVIANLFDLPLTSGFNENYTFNEKIILFVIAGPIIETFLFQYGVIEICKSAKISLKYCCILSAFIFALFHLYNVFYFFYAFVTGLLFAFLYTRGKNTKNAIVVTMIAHAIYNGFVFIMKTYFS